MLSGSTLTSRHVARRNVLTPHKLSFRGRRWVFIGTVLLKKLMLGVLQPSGLYGAFLFQVKRNLLFELFGCSTVHIMWGVSQVLASRRRRAPPTRYRLPVTNVCIPLPRSPIFRARFNALSMSGSIAISTSGSTFL